MIFDDLIFMIFGDFSKSDKGFLSDFEKMVY